MSIDEVLSREESEVCKKMINGPISQTIKKRSVLSYLNQEVEVTERCSHMKLGENVILYASATTYGSSITLITHSIVRAYNEVLIHHGKAHAVNLQLYLPSKYREMKVKEFTQKAKSVCESLQLEIRSIHIESSAFTSQMQLIAQVIGTCEREPQVMKLDRNAHSNSNELNPNRFLEIHGMKQGKQIVIIGKIATEGALRILKQKEKELLQRFTSMYLRPIYEYEHEMLQVGFVQHMRSLDEISSILSIGEGGIYAALWELGEKFHCGLQVLIREIPILQETIEVCERYGLNPYQMTSAGSFLVVCEDVERLKEQVPELEVHRIGELTEDQARFLLHHEEKRFLEKAGQDEYLRFLIEQQVN